MQNWKTRCVFIIVLLTYPVVAKRFSTFEAAAVEIEDAETFQKTENLQDEKNEEPPDPADAEETDDDDASDTNDASDHILPEENANSLGQVSNQTGIEETIPYWAAKPPPSSFIHVTGGEDIPLDALQAHVDCKVVNGPKGKGLCTKVMTRDDNDGNWNGIDKFCGQEVNEQMGQAHEIIEDAMWFEEEEDETYDQMISGKIDQLVDLTTQNQYLRKYLQESKYSKALGLPLEDPTNKEQLLAWLKSFRSLCYVTRWHFNCSTSSYRPSTFDISNEHEAKISLFLQQLEEAETCEFEIFGNEPATVISKPTDVNDPWFKKDNALCAGWIFVQFDEPYNVFGLDKLWVSVGAMANVEVAPGSVPTVVHKAEECTTTTTTTTATKTIIEQLFQQNLPSITGKCQQDEQECLNMAATNRKDRWLGPCCRLHCFVNYDKDKCLERADSICLKFASGKPSAVKDCTDGMKKVRKELRSQKASSSSYLEKGNPGPDEVASTHPIGEVSDAVSREPSSSLLPDTLQSSVGGFA